MRKVLFFSLLKWGLLWYYEIIVKVYFKKTLHLNAAALNILTYIHPEFLVCIFWECNHMFKQLFWLWNSLEVIPKYWGDRQRPILMLWAALKIHGVSNSSGQTAGITSLRNNCPSWIFTLSFLSMALSCPIISWLCNSSLLE